KLTGPGIKAVDRAAVRVVRDQQRVAEWPKILGRDGDAPGLVQGRARRECFYERSVFPEDVDVAAWGFVCLGKRYVNQAIDVLNAERRIAGGQRGVGKRIDQVEVCVVDIDYVVSQIGGIKQVPRRPVGNGEAREHRVGRRVIHRDYRSVGIRLRSPS